MSDQILSWQTDVSQIRQFTSWVALLGPQVTRPTPGPFYILWAGLNASFHMLGVLASVFIRILHLNTNNTKLLPHYVITLHNFSFLLASSYVSAPGIDNYALDVKRFCWIIFPSYCFVSHDCLFSHDFVQTSLNVVKFNKKYWLCIHLHTLS